jgi:predicted nucleic acid-binding protein
MIIDTTYLLPLIGIGIDVDLFRALIEGRTKRRVDLGDLAVNSITLFELQALGAKRGISPSRVLRALDVIMRNFRVIPYYEGAVVRYSYELRKYLQDYIDCVIVATAITLGEDLATEDRAIHQLKETLKSVYGIDVYNYRELVG